MKTNIDYWQEMLKNLPASYKKWFAEEKKYLRKIITPDAKVLDVGCGDGRSIFDIISITKNVIGIDHDKNAILDAKKNFSKYPSVAFVKEDATNLSFKDEEFDSVICMGTFANFAENKITILREMRRVLKKSGKIVISVFSEDAFDERMKLYKALETKIKEIKGETVIFDESFGDNVSEQFSKKQLEDLFSQSNLHIEDMTKVNIAYLCTLTK
jgi:ubiquinone/menaquinone biosynthesis C-methylase UbiE